MHSKAAISSAIFSFPFFLEFEQTRFILLECHKIIFAMLVYVIYVRSNVHVSSLVKVKSPL